MPRSRNSSAIVGVSDHAGWAVLVTVADDGTVCDRRRVELIDADLPNMPIHHDAQALPAAQAIALVERVRTSAVRCAKRTLATLANDVSLAIRGIALRECPTLPPTILEQIANYRARNVADWVMYRRALADAAESVG